MRFSLRRRKLATFNNLKARRGSPPSCLWWCSVMFDSRRWRIHRVSCSFPPNGKRIIAASLKQCLHWTPSIQLSQTLCAVFFSSLEWRHAYLELHSEVPSNFHNPCSFFMSTWLLCASGQGNLSTEESCAASRSVLKWLFLCDCFLLKFMASLHHSSFFILFFLILSPYFHSTGVKEQDWWVFFPACRWHRITGSPCPQQAGFWSWLCLSLNRYSCFILSKAAVALYFNLIPYFKPAVLAAKLIT